MGNLMFAFQRFLEMEDDDEVDANVEHEGDGDNRNRMRQGAPRNRDRHNRAEAARRFRRFRRDLRRMDAHELLLHLNEHGGVRDEDLEMFLVLRQREMIEHFAEINNINIEAMERIVREGPPFDFDFLDGRQRIIPERLEDVMLAPQPEPVYVRPFPLKTACDFNIQYLRPTQSEHSWNGLTWTVSCENYLSATKLRVSRLTLVFSGIEDRCFQVTSSCSFSRTVTNYYAREKQVFLVDKNHRTYVFPELQISGPFRLDNGMLDPRFTFYYSVDHIEFAPQFVYQEQSWPMADRWVSFQDVYSMKFRLDTFRLHNPKLNRLLEDISNGTLSRKEADAFYLFAGFLCNKWYVSTKIFHDLLINAYKLGFTENWDTFDTPDSGFDFNTKTLLPFYHDFVTEEPREQVGFAPTPPSGVCQIFRMDMSPDEMHKRNQIETMRCAAGHRGQFTFYLEDSPNGLLLMMGGVFQVVGRQIAKLKLTFFEHGVKSALYTSYRILHDQQRTFGFVVAVLSEEQVELLKGGYLSVGIQLHFQNSVATFVRTHQDEDDYFSPFIMPGPLNAWIICGDGEKIGVCKEFVSNHCDQLAIKFYNTAFADCGSDTVQVRESSSTVLLALEILYHRSLALSFDTFRGVLGLAGYWLSNMIKRYIEVAILHTNQIEPSDKLALARVFDLDMIKYITRHPEYASGCAVKVSDTERAQVAVPSPNELDGGPLGRAPAERRD